MENWITDFMSDYGYLGIFFLIAVENLFPPIPSEVILTFGGFMTTFSELSIPGVVLFATLGSTAGAVVLYLIGYILNESRVRSLVERWGKYVRLTTADVDKAYGWFNKYGLWTVFLCRLVPLLRSLISIPAGSSRMNFPIFMLLTIIGSLIWNTILVTIGAAVGNSWEIIVEYMDVYSNIVYAAIAIGMLAVVFYLISRKNKS